MQLLGLCTSIWLFRQISEPSASNSRDKATALERERVSVVSRQEQHQSNHFCVEELPRNIRVPVAFPRLGVSWSRGELLQYCARDEAIIFVFSSHRRSQLEPLNVHYLLCAPFILFPIWDMYTVYSCCSRSTFHRIPIFSNLPSLQYIR